MLNALQYATVGQGLLAGLAILFCAMIIDRIVQGAQDTHEPATLSQELEALRRSASVTFILRSRP